MSGLLALLMNIVKEPLIYTVNAYVFAQVSFHKLNLGRNFCIFRASSSLFCLVYIFHFSCISFLCAPYAKVQKYVKLES